MEPSLLDRLLAISELLQRDMARAFTDTVLTPARVAVLWTVQLKGPSTQQAVAGALGVSARNVSGLVDALESSGHLRRTPHPTDRRAVLLALTPEAADLMSTMQREHRALTADLLSAVGPDDLAPLERGIDAIATRLAELVDEAATTDSAQGGAGS